jgi:SAM-dependent methyltransferase
MHGYSAGFARVYNLRWGSFAQHVAPLIRAYYEAQPVSANNRTLLDVCCGTGQLARLFLEAGYRVVGIDLSEPMLAYARENNAPYIQQGQARFLQADATDFHLDERFGLVVATFDALNHLEDESALRRCFQCVFAALEGNGIFIFDLNTRLGLRRWNGINIDDGDELVIINRGIYDGGSNKAWARITGFYREGEEIYRRFEETAFNTLFDFPRVRQMLLETGWKNAHFARVQDLSAPLADPEQEGRVFIVAGK